MDLLPSEIVLYIISFLSAGEIVNLQLVSHRLFQIARDNNLWRSQCFENSSWEAFRQRRKQLTRVTTQQSLPRDFRSALANGEPAENRNNPKIDRQNAEAKANERIRIMTNWDPSYQDEKIDWYSEFIHRSGPINISWLQQPHNRESTVHELMEIRGVGTYNPPGDEGTSMAVGPLDDGSICLWDVSRSSDRQGKIVGRSSSNILTSTGFSSDTQRSRMINTGVIECVSIDNHRKRVYIAVQSELVEVDLETLRVISQEKFPFSIAAISEAKHGTPITVGTTLSLHLHDPRAKVLGATSFDYPERLDNVLPGLHNSAFQGYLTPQPTNYAPLFHPGPLSIIHIPTSRDSWDGCGEIYVAGRFPSILNYDRRYFPRLRGTIHSGARLCSITSMPYSFSAKSKDCMRRAEFSVEQVYAAKKLPGNTLIACGEYNSKGSLELYGVSPHSHLTSMSSDPLANRTQNHDCLKNRQTSSSSKLLSVSTHGTCIVFSDGSGNIKWVERDGFTEVRNWNISHGSVPGAPGIFGSLGDPYISSTSGDIVRKILHTDPKAEQLQNPVHKDDLMIWTGEKIGLLNFSGKPAFTPTSFEESTKTAEAEVEEREERLYRQTMKRALQRQADEIRWVQGLGLGTI